MYAKTPAEVHRLFTEAFLAQDLDRLLSLFEPGATLVPQPGQPVSGAAAICQALAEFLALKGEFTMEPAQVIQTEEIALVCSRWRLVGTAADGSRVELVGQTSDVVRRQSDGRWLLVIDSPFGVAGLANP